MRFESPEIEIVMVSTDIITNSAVKPSFDPGGDITTEEDEF